MRGRIILWTIVTACGVIALLPFNLFEVSSRKQSQKHISGSYVSKFGLRISTINYSSSAIDVTSGTYSTQPARSARMPEANYSDMEVKYSTHNPICVQVKTMTVQDILTATMMCSRTYFARTCDHLLLCKVVILTALSDNHYREALDFIGSTQRYLPHRPIIVYDLGLNSTNIKSLQSFCGVYLKWFKFHNYPEHVDNLRTYAWKPLIINETLPEGYELTLWCDSSCRFSGSIGRYLRYLARQPIIPGPQGGHAFITALHDGMMRYLGLNNSRRYYSTIDISLQVVGILWLRQDVREHFLKYWVDCAMHKECIAPLGAKAHPCNGSLYGKDGTYANCHRFDQSAYNAILTREYGMTYTQFLYSKRLLVMSIVRKPKKLKYRLRKCYHQ